MLLRSSSNSVLESLLPLPLQVSCHTDPSSDITIKHHENPALQPGEPVVPKSLSFTNSCRGTTTPSSLTHSDPQLPLSSPLGACRSGSFSSIRKVLSENDLFVLADGSFASATPAQFAANSLLQDDIAENYPPSSSDLDLAIPRSPHPHVRKRTTSPLGLSRWRSLGSLPSELLSVLYDSDTAISEEGDLASSISSSATIDEAEERERRISTFDKLALPVGDTLNAEVEQASDTTDRVSFKLPHSSLSQSKSDKTHALRQGGELDAEMAGLEMNLSIHGVDAGFSGSQKPSYMVGQGVSCLLEGAIGTTVSQPKFVCETALGAGAGGRGNRPPTNGAGRGGSGGGDAGGCGGKNSDPTELHYQSMLKESPSHPLILQNYAQYLAEVKHDYKRAEEFFERAILVNPSDGELLGQYAKLLWEVQQDRERAATYFERAVQAVPDNSYVMAAYASFLWSAEEEEEEEEEQESVEEVKGSSPANVPASIFSLVSTGPS